jgi:serine/threonine-protein kinase HipA
VSELNVWMNGELVARWTQVRGAHTLVYDQGWEESAQYRPLSLSLPMTPDRTNKGAVVASYFDNLLPDNFDIRRRMTTRYNARSPGVFDLLTAVGRDCVGAVQLLPVDEKPEGVRRIESMSLTEADVASILRETPTSSARAGSIDVSHFRISIAGAQEKTALLRIEDKWHLPLGATPTTHILKLPIARVSGLDFSNSVENEWLCLRLLGLLRLPVAVAEIGVFETEKALVVERFDRLRMADPEWIARLPQEDFCQALGLPPSEKYESDNGPTMGDCMKLLAGSRQWYVDQTTFLLTQLAFWMLAAIDGHAKNFSIFHERAGGFVMTPLYDVLSAWPVVGTGPNQLPLEKVHLAMAVHADRGLFLMNEIQPEHWIDVAKASHLRGMLESMRLLAVGVDEAIAAARATLPAEFPEQVFKRITEGMATQANRFVAALPA